jgi:hypothetical protein
VDWLVDWLVGGESRHYLCVDHANMVGPPCLCVCVFMWWTFHSHARTPNPPHPPHPSTHLSKSQNKTKSPRPSPTQKQTKQVKARGADLIVITDSPKLARGLVNDPIIIPSNGPLTALIATLPLQLLAYELAILKVGRDVRSVLGWILVWLGSCVWWGRLVGLGGACLL